MNYEQINTATENAISTIHKIRALISVAENYRNAFYIPIPPTTYGCVLEEIRGTIPLFSWRDGYNTYTAGYSVKCHNYHIYAKGSYYCDGKKTNLTAIKNSLKRLEAEEEKENV